MPNMARAKSTNALQPLFNVSSPGKAAQISHVLPIATSRSFIFLGSQHVPAPGIHSAFGGEHWAKMKMMTMLEATKVETDRK